MTSGVSAARNVPTRVPSRSYEIVMTVFFYNFLDSCFLSQVQVFFGSIFFFWSRTIFPGSPIKSPINHASVTSQISQSGLSRPRAAHRRRAHCKEISDQNPCLLLDETISRFRLTSWCKERWHILDICTSFSKSSCTICFLLNSSLMVPGRVEISRQI